MRIDVLEEELREEIDLCYKYYSEEDLDKNKTEHERLAFKIATMCMQTLSALKDGELLEELKRLRKWKSDVMEEFCKCDCNSVEEVRHNAYNKAIDDFAKEISDLSKKRYMHDIYQDDIQDIKDKLKGEKNE